MREAVECVGFAGRYYMQLVEDTCPTDCQRYDAAEWLSGCPDSKRRSRFDSGSCQAGNCCQSLKRVSGNCHVYVDSCLDGDADYEMAVRIIDNAKTQRPSVCNAIEGLLVHEAVAEKLLPNGTEGTCCA